MKIKFQCVKYFRLSVFIDWMDEMTETIHELETDSSSAHVYKSVVTNFEVRNY